MSPYSGNARARIDTTMRRYLPAIGRFLIVVTFLEDTLRIMTQWSDQLTYLHDYRKSKKMPSPSLGRPSRSLREMLTRALHSS